MKKKEETKEELEAKVRALQDQAGILYNKLQQADYSNFYHRLTYLFKVVENADKFSEKFVDTCIDEIELLMLGSEEEEK